MRLVRGQQHEFVLGFRTIVLADPSLGTLTETYYWLRYQNGKAVQGRTDERGRLRVRTDWGAFVDIAIQARVQTRALRVMLSKDPASSPRGAWARLVNIGVVDASEPSPEPSPDDLSEALRAFQIKHGLPRSGKLDAATAEKLQDVAS